MNAFRMVALIACLSRTNSLFLPRLMAATAFAPPRHNIALRTISGSIPTIHSSLLPFDSTSKSLSHHETCNYKFAHQLYSTTSHHSSNANNELITQDFNNAEEIDPYSEEAKEKLANFYESNGIDTDDIDAVHKSLLRLTEQVLSWNQRLNLVSRKDCNAAVVYHRHVLPSVALLPLILQEQSSLIDSEDNEKKVMNIVDVGTGGGFPGLPLAVLLPNVQFTLVDSVQKKLAAVADMAAELDVTNVRVHWGRVEEMYADEKGRREHMGKYDVCLGRSVTALPRFCGWISDLLKKSNGEERGGRLIYIIGGELEEVVTSRIQLDVPLDELLHRSKGTSDKRALIFNASDVEEIGIESGEKEKIVRTGPGRRNNKNKSNNKGKKMAKGAWSKKQNDVKKQRGYDDFQRYEF